MALFFVSWVVLIKPDRVRRPGLVHELFTWSEVSTPRCPPPGSVTETMKELAGQGGHLVDSYERRSSVTSSFSYGNDRKHPAHAGTREYGSRTRSPIAHLQIHRRFRDKNGGDENAAARTAGHRRAGPAAARRRGRAGPHRTRCDDHGPQGPQPLPLRRRAGPHRARLAARRRGLRALRTDPGGGRGRGPRHAARRSSATSRRTSSWPASGTGCRCSPCTSRWRSRRSPSMSYDRSRASAPGTSRPWWTGTGG